ncbi:MAG: hypothetical protein AAGB12_02715 [Pseudomonadota bacterium]
MFIRIISLLFIFTLYGCVTPSPMPNVPGAQTPFQQRIDNFEKQFCCTQINHDLQINQIEEDMVFTLKENANLIKREKLKTHYRIYELPDAADEYTFELKSFVINQQFAVIPRIVIFDKDFKRLASSSHQNIFYIKGRNGSGAGYSMYFYINTATDPNQKYFMIHSNKKAGSIHHIATRKQIIEKKMNVQGTTINYNTLRIIEGSTHLVSPTGVLQMRRVDNWRNSKNKAYAFILRPR